MLNSKKTKKILNRIKTTDDAITKKKNSNEISRYTFVPTVVCIKLFILTIRIFKT
jgi:hypothetical protein